MAVVSLSPREIVCGLDGECFVPWWSTKTGLIVRWVIFLSLLGIVLLYVVVGHLHARRRIKKGLQPLAYHRCLVSRKHYAPPATYEQTQWPQQTGYYYPPQQQGAYPMNDMPLPAYDPNRPPKYSGPEGGSKVDPMQSSQNTNRVPESNPAPAYMPPQGPPPNR